MATIDFQPPTTPRSDLLGVGLFLFHLAVGAYVLTGWMVPIEEGLLLYLLFLPLMAGQWLVNQRSCVINNIETWLRSGRWRDPRVNPQEGRFLATLGEWLFRVRPSDTAIDSFCFGSVFVLWLLALAHLSLLEQPQLLAALYG